MAENFFYLCSSWIQSASNNNEKDKIYIQVLIYCTLSFTMKFKYLMILNLIVFKKNNIVFVLLVSAIM